ncbi:thiol peroxidase [Sediminitomix flava]|uniref:Thiol peroxidase n=1 Tax=Sediminitomix flava TaxID=379075 RepID=A0A315ZIA9_SEDFL|nr:thiol peroxidase [Sediminitomix flava]PWJ44840.1 thiol peroxidase (atypical 2-Cys peroxiredoxin) [Sediminitomix flava]
MATITLKGNKIHTEGSLPELGIKAPSFRLTKTDLTDVSLEDFRGQRIILNIFPSIDTSVCAASTRAFNERASQLENTVVLCVSKDLPFAHKRFCEGEGLENVIATSQYKDPEFEQNYAVNIIDGPLAGLFSRAIVVINADGNIVYTEQVPEIAQEPDYDKAIEALEL